MTSRLRATSLAHLPAAIERPAYAFAEAQIGVVHLGPGAFHRAHQAWYFDDALGADPRWAVSAVSLKSAGLRDALAAQDGLYTVAVLDAELRMRVIGALRERLVASEQREPALGRLAAATTRIVTLTITEKGYCLRADGTLDTGHPDIAADLANPRAPVSALGHLVEGLRRRRDTRLPPFTTISCDNLADNGGKLGRAVAELARAHDAGLAHWIEAEAAFPRTMVDCIVPATDAALEQRVAAALGVVDAWPVQRESFSQWVIEDRFCNATPDWAALGVAVTDDVAGFEQAKLRLLNGAHSTLAYLGLQRGHATVADAITDRELAAFVERLMRVDILPCVASPVGFDANAYVTQVLARFRNPAMRHALAQIAWDGSQKLPFRILGTIRDALAAGRSIERLCMPIAAWLHFLRGAHQNGRALVDPLSLELLDRASACDGNPAHDVALFLGIYQVFGADLPAQPRFVAAFEGAYAQLASANAPLT